MKLDYSVLPKGSIYVKNMHSGEIIIIDPDKVPASFFPNDFQRIEVEVEVVKEEVGEEVVVPEPTPFEEIEVKIDKRKKAYKETK